MSRKNKILLGIAAVLPLLYTLILLPGGMFLAITKDKTLLGIISHYLPLVAIVHLLFTFFFIGLMLCFIVMLINFRSLNDKQKLMWVIILVFLNIFAFPLFWYKLIWSSDMGCCPDEDTRPVS